MLDHPEQVERLLGSLDASLPLTVILSPELSAVLRKQNPDVVVPRECAVTAVHYAGDEGGIMCRLALGPADEEKVVYTSITHLAVRPGGPLAREIRAYQKHRLKRLRRGLG